jgi:hypothetical protein
VRLQRPGARSGCAAGYDRPLKLVHTRTNVFTVTATAQELSALIAAGRMSVAAMEKDPHAPTEALELLRSVLEDYDRALARLHERGGRSSRPPRDSS